MKVKDFMIKDVISVRKDTTVKELLTLFVQHRIGGVPVVDEYNKLIGIVTDGDVLRYLSPKKTTVHDLFYVAYIIEAETSDEVLAVKMDKQVTDMIKNKRIISVSPEDHFDEAIRLLSKHHFKKLPVIDNNQVVVGVISRGDIIYNLSKKLLADKA